MGNLENKLDKIVKDSEKKMEEIYSSALLATMKKNKSKLNEIKRIMNDEVKPPLWIRNEDKKAEWKRKRLSKLLDDRLAVSLAVGIVEAGEEAEKEIKSMGYKTFVEAYNGTIEDLRR